MSQQAASILAAVRLLGEEPPGTAFEVRPDGSRVVVEIVPSLDQLHADAGSGDAPTVRLATGDGAPATLVVRPLPNGPLAVLALDPAAVDARLSAVVENLVNQMAHDIRNHVFSLRLQSEMGQRRSASTPELRSHFDAALRQIDALTAYLDRLLLFGRPASLDRRMTNPAALVREAVQRFTAAWDHAAQPISIAVECADEEGVASLDQRALGVVIANLLDNAARSATPPPEITVRVTGGTADVRIEVADRGPGIPPESVPKLFVPMLLRRGGAAGLGLAIARKLVEAHGGSVAVQTSPAGTSVLVTLPRGVQT